MKSFLAFFCLAAALITGTSAFAGSFSDSAVEIVVGDGHGSGVYLGNGYVLTAGHVAKNTIDGTVEVKKQRSADWTDTWTAKVLWVDETQDFALLKIAAAEVPLPAAPLGCQTPALSQELFIVGWPLDMGMTITKGYVATGVAKRGQWEHALVAVAPITFGNSGGPAFDANGNVVGLVVGIYGGTSLSLVIPTSAVCSELPPGAK